MTMPSWTDGDFVHQPHLNLLSNGVINLSVLLAGVPPPRTYIPAATANITSLKTISNRTDTRVIFDSAGVNNDAVWVASRAAFIIKTGGVYVAFGQVCWSQNGTGRRSCSILLNGVAPDGNGVALASEQNVSSTDLTTMAVETAPMALSPGAALYFNVWQSSGGSLTIDTGFSGTFMGVQRIGNQL